MWLAHMGLPRRPGGPLQSRAVSPIRHTQQCGRMYAQGCPRIFALLETVESFPERSLFACQAQATTPAPSSASLSVGKGSLGKERAVCRKVDEPQPKVAALLFATSLSTILCSHLRNRLASLQDDPQSAAVEAIPI
jgi:hypothetical protein